MDFLAGQLEKSVKLERLLGIGGEGVVLSAKMTTIERFIDFEKGSETKEEREVAIKFVKFEKDEKEVLEGPEEEDERGEYGGIDIYGEFVKSQYFKRLKELGDYAAATFNVTGGYSRPFIDFGISKIHKNYFYVIGEFRLNFNRFSVESYFIN